MPNLTVRHLTRLAPRRPSDGPLLDAIGFELRPGERIALSGKSGAGKSLLMRALVRLDTIDAGDTRLDGRLLASDWIAQFRTEVAYLPQRCALLAGTVRQNLERAVGLAIHHGTPSSFDALSATTQVGYATELLDRDVRLLSGGELQWVNIQRTLQFSPSILLLPESPPSRSPKFEPRRFSMLAYVSPAASPVFGKLGIGVSPAVTPLPENS